MLKQLAAILLAAASTIAAISPVRAQQTLSTSAIAQAIGRNGTSMPDGVYRVVFPRSDLHITIGNVQLSPGLALGSYAAFKAEGQSALAVGDLVLLEDEIAPVMNSLRESGLEITALHNHLRNERPHVMYMHFMGRGDAATIASALRKALALTQTPFGPAAHANAAMPWFAATVQQTLGRTGKASNGVLAINIPRNEAITMQGMSVPPAMGVATALNFQSAGNSQVATTGDFVLIATEVAPVQQALLSHSFDVTALHSHMLGDSPPLYYMHFWAVGAPAALAAGLKDALSHVAAKGG